MRIVLTKIGRDPMKHACIVFLLASLMTSPALASPAAPDSVAARIARVAQKDSITVLVTDSGLGGLSVCADLDARVRRTGAYRKVRIIFANALPESNRGYNRMKTTEEKVRVFDAALHGMARTFSPDVILVACNTLSVLIPQTGFVATSRIPVLGIVETGVGMLYEQLSADPASTAVIFGTETTIGADTHRRLLIGRGIDPARLVTQACPNLAGAIETDVRSAKVSKAITAFASEAAGKIAPGTGRVLAGLCCTHYGYAAGQFQAALGAGGQRKVMIVDPNTRMNDVLFPAGKGRLTEHPACSVEVTSRAVISSEEVASIGGLVQEVSPATAAALRAHTLDKQLFPFEPDTKE
jgi:glutamate racemase